MTDRKKNQRERLQKRNELVTREFEAICRKEPKWRHEEHLKHCAERFFISKRTVSAILNGEYETRFFADTDQLQLFDKA